MKKDNKGLTLIEMIVTVAIIAIFAGIVMSFITSSSNEFRSTSSNAKIQMQTQETLNQIQELLIDANRGIQYKVDGVETESDFSDGSSSGDNKELSVMSVFEDENKVEIHTLVWSRTDSELIYAYDEKKIESIDSNNKIIFKAGTQKQIENGKVLLQNIKDFQVDLSQVEQEKTVRFKLSVEEKGKKITTEHVVNLRNKISVMDIDGAVIKGEDGKGKICISSPDDGAPYNVGSSFSAGWKPAADSTADIRLSSIKWSAVSPDGGVQFTLTQSRDIANIKITGGSGSLRITVTAEDAFGNLSEDTISINVIGIFKLEELKLEGINLVGAGNIYQLEDCWQVSGTMTNGKETRDATVEELGQLKWSADGKEISKTLDVDANRGAVGDSQIRLSVKSGDIESTISVAIARVDITNLLPIITNTKDKQIYNATYIGGGVQKTITGTMKNVNGYPVTWKLDKNGSSVQTLMNEFKKDDNGTWTVYVKVDLGDLGGEISDKKTFDVNIPDGETSIQIIEYPKEIKISTQDSSSKYPISPEIKVNGEKLQKISWDSLKWNLVWENGSSVVGANINNNWNIHVLKKLEEEVLNYIRYATLTATYILDGGKTISSDPVTIAFLAPDVYEASPGEDIYIGVWEYNLNALALNQIVIYNRDNKGEIIVKDWNENFIKSEKYISILGWPLKFGLGGDDILKNVEYIQYRYRKDTNSEPTIFYTFYIKH